jgi:hypothetical protein
MSDESDKLTKLNNIPRAQPYTNKVLCVTLYITHNFIKNYLKIKKIQMTILYIFKKKKMTKKKKYSVCECTDILAIALSPHRETCESSLC